MASGRVGRGGFYALQFALPCLVFLSPLVATALTHGDFGPKGAGGSLNGQPFRLATGGEVFELDAFLHVEGHDLNGNETGASARLSRDALPPGLAFAFSAAASDNAGSLRLTYTFTNDSGEPFHDVRFFCLLDTEISQRTNTFFNEHVRRVGKWGDDDADPDYWDADEPGYVQGKIVDRIRAGRPANPGGAHLLEMDDACMVLGFSLGSLQRGDRASVDIQVADDGTYAGNGALVQADTDPVAPCTVTFSGLAKSPPTTCHLDIGADHGGSVSRKTGWYPRGSDQSATAMPAAHYHFTGWTGDTNGCSFPDAQGILIPLWTSRTVRAVFEIDTFTVAFDAGEHGVIAAGNSVQTVPYGADATPPPVQPSQGWLFAGWGAPYTNVTGHATIAALYDRIIEIELFRPSIADRLTVHWLSQSGRTYRVQGKHRLGDPVWLDVPGDVTATGESAEKPLSGATNRVQYFRIIYAP